MSRATLFIPDITGFTKFVKSTEINHSKHIIEELIKIIIQEGKKEFEMVEVEGDAVFFYKEDLVSPEVVVRTAKKIFIQFHKHLLDYEHNRICECGACTTAVDLKLKFITHSGDISMANYGVGRAKPYGDAVIAAHRLLKNEVAVEQYILFTDQLLQNSNLTLDGPGSLHDDSLGDVDFKYLDINHWKAEVIADKKELVRTYVDLEVSSVHELALNAFSLHRFISEFKYRHLWNKEATRVIFDESAINQAGTEHFCVVSGKDLVFDTIKPDYIEGLSYGEILKNPAPLKYMENNFLISELSANTSRLKIVIRVSLKWKLQKLLVPMLKRKLRTQMNQIIQSLTEAITQIPKEELAA